MVKLISSVAAPAGAPQANNCKNCDVRSFQDRKTINYTVKEQKTRMKQKSDENETNGETTEGFHAIK